MTDRTLTAVLTNLRRDVTSLQRRLARLGAGGGTPPAPTPVPEPFIIPRPTDNNTVTATAQWGQTLYSGSMTVAEPLWVLVTLGVWAVATAGETRAGVALTGATTVNAAQEQFTAISIWGQTIYAAFNAIQSGTSQQNLQRTLRLEPGTTNIVVQAYQSGGGTHSINYPVLQVTPLRWA